jgi:predicted HTH transcriptional regulator
MVKHSLDPGMMEDTVQYETVWKIKSAFVNMYHASVENKGTAIIGVKDGNKLLVLGAPVYHGWYN